MNNFQLRSVTGALYVALITVGILINSYTFLGLFSLVVWLCLREFYCLVNAQKRTAILIWPNCLGGVLLFISTYLYASGICGRFIFCIYLLYLVATFISELYKKQSDPLNHLAYIFLGQVYIALPLALLNGLAFPALAGGSYYSLLVLALFIFLWVNDTFAYSVGVLFGKHRLFPRISPKKSWEGFFGGLVFTVMSSLIFAHFEPEIPYYHWIGMSIIVVIFSTWGDLVESLMKRTFEVKDSGHALPGHGGFLDRFDSLLLAVYGMFFYLLCLIQNSMSA
ncbi:MAG: phosphatidate cytidylyltransferase [Dysgonamonadaceae bacterium]|jgi:phosphatidate cytidylyltransferase|nr:phosphatidate cytidylyltransferase [Dysgonamonadaceae bacterium]